LIILLLFEVVVYFSINDFSVPTIEFPKNYKKILIVFPHADDEVLTTSGIMKKYSKTKNITWMIMTKGERGTPDASIDENLKEIRVKEAKKVLT
jgi:LmbE family N-acetylglucosaminyl deacetylase